jgi:hypothetical protein
MLAFCEYASGVLFWMDTVIFTQRHKGKEVQSIKEAKNGF